MTRASTSQGSSEEKFSFRRKGGCKEQAMLAFRVSVGMANLHSLSGGVGVLPFRWGQLALNSEWPSKAPSVLWLKSGQSAAPKEGSSTRRPHIDILGLSRHRANHLKRAESSTECRPPDHGTLCHRHLSLPLHSSLPCPSPKTRSMALNRLAIRPATTNTMGSPRKSSLFIAPLMTQRGHAASSNLVMSR